MSAISGLAGLVFGAWRWGRAGAKAEQAVKEDYERKIAVVEQTADARLDLLVEQFKESFEGLRRQMDQNTLETERRFLSQPAFDKFCVEYRRNQDRTDDKLDRLLGMKG
jgi:hypothetical protein